jgi:hypothetical protein
MGTYRGRATRHQSTALLGACDAEDGDRRTAYCSAASSACRTCSPASSSANEFGRRLLFRSTVEWGLGMRTARELQRQCRERSRSPFHDFRMSRGVTWLDADRRLRLSRSDYRRSFSQHRMTLQSESRRGGCCERPSVRVNRCTHSVITPRRHSSTTESRWWRWITISVTSVPADFSGSSRTTRGGWFRRSAAVGSRRHRR